MNFSQLLEYGIFLESHSVDVFKRFPKMTPEIKKNK